MLLAIDGGEKRDLKRGSITSSPKIFAEKYSGTDDGITVTVAKTGEGAAPALHPVSLQKPSFS